MNIYFKVFTLITALLLAGSTHAQLLYKVEGNGLTSPSYIFGSHHLAPLDIIEKTHADTYFENAGQVVGEIDLTLDPTVIAIAVQPHMMAPADSTISMVVSPEDYAIISEEFKKWAPMPGMELSMLDMLKPMAVSTMVTVGIMSKNMPDFDPSQQLDSYFMINGKNADKKIIPLETPEFQGEVLYDSTPISVQAEALVEILKNPEKGIENANKLNEAYENQDLDAMLALSEAEDDHPEFMQAILDKRNADWLTKLPGIFNDGSTFVVVGALHLPGENGILEGLRKLGFEVDPL